MLADFVTREIDLLNDFAPLTLVAEVPSVLVVRPEPDIRTLNDFVRHAKANPNKQQCGPQAPRSAEFCFSSFVECF